MPSHEIYCVFVVDPDSAIRDSVELLLESSTVAVHGYATGQSFLSDTARRANGCLLVESSLPDSSGLSLIAQLRKLGNDMPALLLTSSTDRSLATRVAELGVAGIVRKPLHSQQVLDQIEFLRLSHWPDDDCEP